MPLFQHPPVSDPTEKDTDDGRFTSKEPSALRHEYDMWAVDRSIYRVGVRTRK